MSHRLIESKITDLYVINFSEFMISKNLLQKILWNVPIKVHIYSQNINEKFKIQSNKFDFDKGVSGQVEETKDVALDINLMSNKVEIKEKIFKLVTEMDKTEDGLNSLFSRHSNDIGMMTDGIKPVL